MDDDDLEIEVLTPQRHNRWAVIVPALDLMSNIALDVHQTFKMWAVLGAQHGMQIHYDRKFREVANGYSDSLED
jgi:hypothetical protein